MTQRAKSSHVGASFSMADLLAVIYAQVLRVDPKRPNWPDRDRFVLSKGHGAAALYAVLAETGFFSTEQLASYCQDGAALAGHVCHIGVPGVDVSTGSLGHGLSIAAGMALSAKRGSQSHRVVTLLSDGECDEGSTWEAVLFSAHHRLDNLIAVIDYNKIQSLGSVNDVLRLEPLVDKWRAFGWAAREIDGHDVSEIGRVLTSIPLERDRPSCVIAHTVKGKGVSFMENTVLWHYRSPQGDEFDAALSELR
jgi:transketolase